MKYASILVKMTLLITHFAFETSIQIQPGMKNFDISWNTAAALMGPVYFLINGRYILGFNLIASFLLLVYWLPDLMYPIMVLLAILAGLSADYFCEQSLIKRRQRLFNKLSNKGYSGSILRTELRKRETSSLYNFTRLLTGVIIYWIFVLIITNQIYMRFEQETQTENQIEIHTYEFIERMGRANDTTPNEELFIASTIEYFGDYQTAYEYYLQQAQSWYDKNLPDSFAVSIMKAYQFNPGDYKQFWLAGKFLYRQEMLLEADRFLTIANQINPFNCKLKSDLAKSCARLSHLSFIDQETREIYAYQSEIFLWDANDKCPRNDYIYNNWAEAFYWDGEYKKAHETLQRIIQMGGKIDSTTQVLISAKIQTEIED